MIGEILLIVALILVNGFFALSEMALVASRKARLRLEADKGKTSYLLALRAAENPGKFLSAIQVAITLIGILTGAVGGATISRTLEAFFHGIPQTKPIAAPLSVGIVVVFTTLLSVILGELVPKSLALAKPESIAAGIIRPLNLLGKLFSPLVKFLSGATSLIVKALGVSPASDPEVTEDEVKVLIAQGTESGIFEDSEREMVEGVLGLDDRRVTSFMTPRTDVATIDVTADNLDLRREIRENAGYAYIPVIEGDLDKIVGMLPLREALAAMVCDADFGLHAHLKKPVLIPETLSALKALAILRDEGAGTALIVDEYGGVSGLVTMSDLLGSVLEGLDKDDSDEVPGIVEREDGSYLVDGALAISTFAESMRLAEDSFDPNAYDTVAGLVLARMGSIPKAGESCTWDGLKIEIMDMDGHRIDKVLVTREIGQASLRELP